MGILRKYLVDTANDPHNGYGNSIAVHGDVPRCDKAPNTPLAGNRTSSITSSPSGGFDGAKQTVLFAFFRSTENGCRENRAFAEVLEASYKTPDKTSAQGPQAAQLHAVAHDFADHLSF